MRPIRQFINKIMKNIYIILAFIFSVTVANANLVMEFYWGGSMMKIVAKVKGDKILLDGYVNESKAASLIEDLKTTNYFKLDHWSKKIIKNPNPLDSNALAPTASPKFQDTGKTEMLDGYEAEIYKWTNSDGVTETLWVAKNFPNFEEMKDDLSKLDKLNDKKWILNFSSLSGMPLKLFIPDKDDARGLTFTLLSAKEEPIDDSVFELPKDYHYYTNAPVANTNEVISATNEPPVK
jgi:Domain of unknown function (DUF4412)